MRVDDRRNTVVVNVNRTAGNSFHAYDPLIFRLMCQHWTRDTVADGVNAAVIKTKKGSNYKRFADTSSC